MRLSNTRDGYGAVAIALHWISAVGVIALYFLGEAGEDAPDRAAHVAAIARHVSWGVLFAAFFVARFLWSASQPAPQKLEANRALRLLAAAVQGLFLAMIAILIVTGPLVVWASARPIAVFDWVSIPSPFPARVGWLKEAAEEVHEFVPNALWPLLGLHVLGALKHLVIDRDATLKRILWPV